jgi:Tfp pilus assembly protein PilZ
MPSNRRLIERLKFNTKVTVNFKDEAPIVTTTIDASPFGAFIKSDVHKPIGTNLTIELTLPQIDKPLVIDCVVAHIRNTTTASLPVGFGVCFILSNPQQITSLVQAFQNLENKQEA